MDSLTGPRNMLPSVLYEMNQLASGGSFPPFVTTPAPSCSVDSSRHNPMYSSNGYPVAYNQGAFGVSRGGPSLHAPPPRQMSGPLPNYQQANLLPQHPDAGFASASPPVGRQGLMGASFPSGLPADFSQGLALRAALPQLDTMTTILPSNVEVPSRASLKRSSTSSLGSAPKRVKRDEGNSGVPVDNGMSSDDTPSPTEGLLPHTTGSAGMLDADSQGDDEPTSGEAGNSTGKKGHAHKKFVDISAYLNMPQKEAAKRLGLPVSTLSKRWKDATDDRKWPYRTIAKIDKQIMGMLNNVTETEALSDDNTMTIRQLLRQRMECLSPVLLRL